MDAWPKLFQNMRASRATELVKDFPEHVVTAWMGHSKKIAQKHCLQVTEDDYKQASYSPHSMSVDSQTLEKSSFPLMLCQEYVVKWG